MLLIRWSKANVVCGQQAQGVVAYIRIRATPLLNPRIAAPKDSAGLRYTPDLDETGWCMRALLHHESNKFAF